jgi:hypothetical protein
MVGSPNWVSGALWSILYLRLRQALAITATTTTTATATTFTADFQGSSLRVDACADAAPILAAEHEPGEALARWMQRYAAFIATKRGLATALHSGNPAFDTLPAYFQQRLEPALRTLLESAAAAGEVRTDIAAEDLLGAVASLCMHAYDQ